MGFKKGFPGFTLLEVLIVVIIVGILAAIALPQYVNTIEKARSGEAVANIGTLRTSIDRYWYQSGTITENPNALDIDNPNSVTNKLYTYSITDDDTSESARVYTVTAERTSAGGTNYWVKWKQTSNTSGKLLRSSNLGGPTQ